MLCEVVLQQHNISIYSENVFMLLFEIIFQTTPVHLIKMSCFFKNTVKRQGSKNRNSNKFQYLPIKLR